MSCAGLGRDEKQTIPRDCGSYKFDYFHVSRLISGSTEATSRLDAKVGMDQTFDPFAHMPRCIRLAGKEQRVKSPVPAAAGAELQLLSVIIPARNEEGCIPSMVENAACGIVSQSRAARDHSCG